MNIWQRNITAMEFFQFNLYIETAPMDLRSDLLKSRRDSAATDNSTMVRISLSK